MGYKYIYIYGSKRCKLTPQTTLQWHARRSPRLGRHSNCSHAERWAGPQFQFRYPARALDRPDWDRVNSVCWPPGVGVEHVGGKCRQRQACVSGRHIYRASKKATIKGCYHNLRLWCRTYGYCKLLQPVLVSASSNVSVYTITTTSTIIMQIYI